MAVFLITTAFLIGYGINLVVLSSTIISSNDSEKRRNAVIALFITLLAAVGVIYLAAH